MKSIDRLFIGKAVQNGNEAAHDEEVWRSTEEGKHFKIESETGEIKAGFGGKLNGKKVDPSKKSQSAKSMSSGPDRSGPNKPQAAAKPASRPAVPAPNKEVKSKEFVNVLSDAKASCPPDKAWRVDTWRGPDDFDSENIKMYRTEGGSTFAIKPDGDIISVCKNQTKDPNTNARDLMAAAVKAGGTHLDSFIGNYGFYVKCGFEVVSRCKFDEEYKPDGWTKGRDDPEDVVFMKYVGVGNVQDKSIEDMLKRVPYSKDYDTAGEVLARSLKGGKG